MNPLAGFRMKALKTYVRSWRIGRSRWSVQSSSSTTKPSPQRRSPGLSRLPKLSVAPQLKVEHGTGGHGLVSTHINETEGIKFVTMYLNNRKQGISAPGKMVEVAKVLVLGWLFSFAGLTVVLLLDLFNGRTDWYVLMFVCQFTGFLAGQWVARFR